MTCRRQPDDDDVSEDDQQAGDGEGEQRERDEEIGADAALPDGPAVAREVVGAAEALHELGDDAGGSGDADDDGDEEDAGGAAVVGGVDEVALQEGADVGGKDAVEEVGELEAEWERCRAGDR